MYILRFCVILILSFPCTPFWSNNNSPFPRCADLLLLTSPFLSLLNFTATSRFTSSTHSRLSPQTFCLFPQLYVFPSRCCMVIGTRVGGETQAAWPGHLHAANNNNPALWLIGKIVGSKVYRKLASSSLFLQSKNSLKDLTVFLEEFRVERQR